jgi:hypothetical protein
MEASHLWLERMKTVSCQRMNPSNGPWKGLTFSVLPSPHHSQLPSPLLLPIWSLLIGLAQSLPHSSQLALLFRFPSCHPVYMVGRAERDKRRWKEKSIGFKGGIRVGLLTWRNQFPEGLVLGGVRLDLEPESR